MLLKLVLLTIFLAITTSIATLPHKPDQSTINEQELLTKVNLFCCGKNFTPDCHEIEETANIISKCIPDMCTVLTNRYPTLRLKCVLACTHWRWRLFAQKYATTTGYAARWLDLYLKTNKLNQRQKLDAMAFLYKTPFKEQLQIRKGDLSAGLKNPNFNARFNCALALDNESEIARPLQVSDWWLKKTAILALAELKSIRLAEHLERISNYKYFYSEDTIPLPRYDVTLLPKEIRTIVTTLKAPLPKAFDAGLMAVAKHSLDAKLRSKAMQLMSPEHAMRMLFEIPSVSAPVKRINL